MRADTERDEALRKLRREVAGRWPESEFRELLLRVLDEMVWETHQSTADTD
jgi:hypothetical protein